MLEHMRRIAFILLISFIAIGVFGFIAMGHEGCIMTIALQDSCMQGQGPFADVALHLQLYMSFSMAVLAALLIAGIWLIAHALMLSYRTTHDNSPRISLRSFTGRKIPRAILGQLLSWLAIHELRDPSAFLKTGA